MFYSQCQEDKFLNENFFKNKKNGIYIELGAHNGITQSNTKFFEETLSWNGILIEAHPNIFDLLRINRPNNYLFNELVSNSKDELNYIYINGIELVGGVKESLSDMHFDKYYNNYPSQGNKIMKPKSLTEIVHSTNITHIDFFSLDVEGHEYEILLSWDFSIPIDLILIETIGVDLNKEQLCRNILLENNYIFKCKCAHNEVFILKTSIYNE